jgi:glycosyltransferase involved in cell wall biosynthesis
VSISLVIPTLNEAANLPHVLTRIPTMVDEVLLVDGHSVDDTIAVARAIRPEIRVLMQRSRGKGNALACGFAAATGDIIVMLDADGSTDPAELPVFIDALLSGSDFAKGSRFLEGGHSSDLTRVRATGNRFLNIAVNTLFRTRYTDLCYGYNAFWRHCLPHMCVTSSGFEVETLINVRIARAGLLVTEVPSIEYERIHGESKLHAVRDGMRALSVIFRERMSRRKVARSDQWEPPFHELPPSVDEECLATDPTLLHAESRLSRTLLVEARPGGDIATLDPASASGPAV